MAAPELVEEFSPEEFGRQGDLRPASGSDNDAGEFVGFGVAVINGSSRAAQEEIAKEGAYLASPDCASGGLHSLGSATNNIYFLLRRLGRRSKVRKGLK